MVEGSGGKVVVVDGGVVEVGVNEVEVDALCAGFEVVVGVELAEPQEAIAKEVTNRADKRDISFFK